MLPLSIPDFIFRQVREAEERADRVYEAIIGIVTDNKDPNKLGRVKVRFPTMPNNDQDTSWWAPISSLGAGKDRGWWFLHEVDDEVLVLFECGDIRRPVVVGALWNGVDKPPESNSGSNPKRLIVSREGSKITFDDDEGTITLEDGAGNGKITISKDNKITIEALQGDLCIYSPKDDTVIVANEISMEGQQNATIAAGGDVKLGTDGSGTLKGGTMVQAQGSKIQLNPGGVQAPDAASLEAAEVQDPLTERISQEQPGDSTAADSQGDGGGGGGGGGGGSDAESGAEEGGQESQEAPGEEGAPLPEEEEHQIEVQLVNVLGDPQPGVTWELKLPDGTVRSGSSGSDGYIRISGLTQTGDATLTLPDQDDDKPKDK
jgi:phage baseplate assembly protein gpV